MSQDKTENNTVSVEGDTLSTDQKNDSESLLYPEDSIFQNQETDNESLNFEIKRRNHLFYLAYFITCTILVFYIMLARWIFCSGLEDNAWHTTLILAAIPTSLCFALLRVISKPEQSHDTKDSESEQTLLKVLISLATHIIDAIRGK